MALRPGSKPPRAHAFALVVWSSFVSNVGSWVQSVAVAVLVTAETRSPLWAALVGAASLAPAALLPPAGSALLERAGRRRVLFTSAAGQGASAALLALLASSSSPSPAAMTLVVLAGQSFAALGVPAYSSLLAGIVPERELPRAVRLSSMQFNVSRVVGPGIGAVAIFTGSYEWAFLFNGLSFVLVMVCLYAARLPGAPDSTTRGHPWGELVEGARECLGDAACRAASYVACLVGLLGAPFMVLVPAMAILQLRAGGTTAAALVGCQGVGALVAALGLGRLSGRLGARTVALGAVLALPLGLVAYGASPKVVVSCSVMVVLGALYAGVLWALSVTVRLRAPQALWGRMLGACLAELALLSALGSVLQGALAGVVGIVPVTIGSAAVLFGALTLLASKSPALLAGLGAVETHEEAAVVLEEAPQVEAARPL